MNVINNNFDGEIIFYANVQHYNRNKIEEVYVVGGSS